MTTPHSSNPAPLSPLAFTLAYQQYRSEASRIPFADTRILKAAQFWMANAAALGSPAFSTYWLEDIPPLLAALNPDQLDDLKLTELEGVAEFVGRVVPLIPPSPHENSLPSRVDIKKAHSSAPLRPSPEGSVGAYGHTPFRPEPGAEHDSSQSVLQSAAIWEHAAKQWLYLGEPGRAIEALRRSRRFAAFPPEELALILSECDTCDATEIPGIVASRVESPHPALARWLRDFDAAWTAQRESGDANRAACLLVEYDANGSPVRGRLRRLEGRVEALNREADSDEVIFHHQVKSPDDPFVGTVYAAFDALRHLTHSRWPLRGIDSSHSERVSLPCHPDERSEEGSAVRPSRHGTEKKQILRRSEPGQGIDPVSAAPQDDSGGVLAQREPAPFATGTIPPCHPEERSDEGSAVHPVGGKLTKAVRRPVPRYRGRFTFNRDGGETYSGDSIGLSAFAVAFGDQWGRKVHRERRLIGRTVAFTGGIGPDGSVQPVSPDSLPLKVERAFHSPITHLVVPEANRKAAEDEAERLRQVHPRRRLHIIGIERPADILADHNIFHTEKLWPGEFAIRKAARYSRSVKVQVPVMVVLGYLLLCLIFPPLWLFFDANPVRIEVTSRGLKALNAKGQTIGGYYSFPQPVLAKRYSADLPADAIRYYLLDDLDGDGRAEVVFCPCYEEGSGPDPQGPLYVFKTHRFGGLDPLFFLPLGVTTSYAGDSSSMSGMTYRYLLCKILTVRSTDGLGRLLVVISVNSEPARAQVALYDERGDRGGLYLNQGQFRPTACVAIDVNGDGVEELCLGGCSNRLDAPVLAILDYRDLAGVSPPWDTPYFLDSHMPKGSQREYYSFAKTATTAGRTLISPVAWLQWDRTNGLLVSVADDSSAYHCQLDTSLVPRHILLDDGNIDLWTARFGRPPDRGVCDSLLALVRMWHDTTPVTP